MKKYRKKPVTIEAEQWFKLGDVPEAPIREHSYPVLDGIGFNDEDCKKCGSPLKHHGWCETLEGGHIVCSGDWIIKGIKGEFYPCKPDVFKLTYDKCYEGPGETKILSSPS